MIAKENCIPVALKRQKQEGGGSMVYEYTRLAPEAGVLLNVDDVVFFVRCSIAMAMLSLQLSTCVSHSKLHRCCSKAIAASSIAMASPD